MTYQEALDFLYTQLPMYQKVGKSAFKKDLTNTIKLCELLGNPQNKFKSIHIAGTNGKGTTAHILSSILQEAGYKTGLYTSPHLKSYTERIKINAIEIEEPFVIDFVDKIKNHISEIQPSFFEITVVMAFAYFVEKKVDIAVIETGLGGRLDSTNVIMPLLSVITNIALDHQDMLGNTIEEIAKEKAGIIKPNVPFVLGNMPNEARQSIMDVGTEKGGLANTAYDKYKIELDSKSSYNVSKHDKLIALKLESGIQGAYIAKNIPHILESINELNKQGFHLSKKYIYSGFKNVISNTNLKGRWQILGQEPLTICDVAHNEDGIRQVVSQIETQNFKQLHIVFGTVADKKIDTILKLLPTDAQYYLCAANVPRALTVGDLYEKMNALDLHIEKYASVTSAITAAQNNAHKDDLIFIGGSTFVLAEIENL